MLTHLYIKNYALIDEFSVDFQQGFNVVSGETGTGKSIMLGALSLILGQRADISSLNHPDNKCIIEGKFQINERRYISFFNKNNLDFDNETILRREITSSGKSRAFINDTPVNLTVLKSFCNINIELHSQHQSLALKDVHTQLNLLDKFCNHEEEILDYKSEYAALLQLKRQLEYLSEKGEMSISEIEFFSFQLEELEKMNLQEGEMQELEDELAILNNSEQIASVLEKGNNILEKENGILDLLSEIIRDFSTISNFNKKVTNLSNRVEQSAIELKDISSEIFYIKEQSLQNPERLKQLNDRIDIINSLLLKHRKNSFSEIIELKKELKQKLDTISNHDIEVEKLRKIILNQEQKLEVLAKRLSKNRRNTAPKIEKQLREILKKLGMYFANFNIEIKELEFCAENGKDCVEFFFSANKGRKVEKLSSVISGGELSRLMLAIKFISSKHQDTETLIFDEVDTGVSGEVANLMGEMMQKIGNEKQLIAITHLPQVAAKGSHHYMIYKEIRSGKTNTLIKQLNRDERVNELAKLLSGKEITTTAIKNAKELLNQ
jgi:DNA repair protein RecN (Recombination protein N)